MFVRRRRPLLGAAMLGGAALAGRRSAQTSYREADQEQRIEQLESEPRSAPAPVAASPSAEDDVVGKLQELNKLLDSGALSKDEFEAAKHKLLAE